ncbi:MAG: hypothetical protein HZB87_06475 [Desulfatitalea sp.]|nr:hypothetical protein [Desulfatitalea sp.]
MSTILKSLKKLEKEKEGQGTPVPAPALISGAGTHQAIHRAVQFAWLKGRILQWSTIGAGCLVIFVIALYAFSRPSPSKPEMVAAPKPIVQQVPKIKPQPRPIQSVPAQAPSPAVQAAESRPVEVNLPPADTAPAGSALPQPMAQRPDTNPAPISPPVAPPPLPKDGFEALGQKPAPSTMGAVPVQKRRPQPKSDQQQAAMTPTPRSIPRPGVVSEEPLSMGIAPVEPAVPAASAPMAPAPVAAAPKENRADLASAAMPSGAQPPVQPQPQSQTGPFKPEQAKPGEAPYAGAERMTDGSLKVQAIVFAPVAEERMAVVNNTIVREGSAIESYTIVGIGEEDVFVREGQGRLLKVPFGKP